MIKYEYETGMCKQLHYNGLWSVQYEGVPGHFKKVRWSVPASETNVIRIVKCLGTYRK